jgi:hypothetical protein
VAQRAYSACDFLLDEAQKICEGAGAQLVVCTIPSPSALGKRAFRLKRYSEHPELFDPDFPDARLGELCRVHNIPFVAAKRYLSLGDYRRPDDHWTGRGHRRMAEILRRIHDDHARGATRAAATGAAVESVPL